MPAVAGASSTIRISLPQWRVEEADTSQIELRATEDDGGEKVEILCTGSADYDRQRLAVSCDYGDVGRLEMIAVRDTMHVRGRDVLGVRGTGRGWLEAPGDGLPSELSPPQLLAMLRGASQQTERLVDEEVRGVETRRYRLEVECEKVELDCSGMTSAEVWIDDDGSLRRVWLDDESGAETIEFFDSGADVAIVPPPADQIEQAADLGSTFCSEGEAGPVTVQEATSVLRRHGFQVTKEGEYCTSAYAVTIVTNSAVVSASSQSALPDEEFVSCTAMRLKPAGRGEMLVDEQYAGAAAKLRLRNLECTLFADGRHAREAVARLKQAFAELEHAIRP